MLHVFYSHARVNFLLSLCMCFNEVGEGGRG